MPGTYIVGIGCYSLYPSPIYMNENLPEHITYTFYLIYLLFFYYFFGGWSWGGGGGDGGLGV